MKLLSARASHSYHFVIAVSRAKDEQSIGVKYWEIMADNLKKAGWSWGCVSAVDFEGRTIWIVEAHRDNGKRFVVRSDEKLSAFLEPERIARISALSSS